MRSCPLIPLLAAALMSAMWISSAAAAPEAAAGAATHVAIVSPSKIFADMREKAVLLDGLKLKQKNITGQAQAQEEAIKAMIQDRDANYNPKHPKYLEICAKIDKAKTDFQGWEALMKLEGEREQKMIVKNLYDKIEAAVAKIAQQKGIDLVIADGRVDISGADVESMTAADLNRLLTSRSIVYATKAIDLTDAVIAQLNVDYNANGAAVPPPVQTQPAK